MPEELYDWLYGVIARPVSTLREVAEKKPACRAFLVYAAATFLSYLAGFSDVDAFLEPLLFIAGGLFFSAAGIFIVAGLLHLLSRLFKSRGGFWNLFSALGFAQFPAILMLPANLLGQLGGAAGALLGGFLSFAVGVWVFALNIIALRESHGISTAASILVFLLALLVLALLIGLPFMVFLLLTLALI